MTIGSIRNLRAKDLRKMSIDRLKAVARIQKRHVTGNEPLLLQPLHPRTQPPEWPIEGTAHVELEDTKGTMTGVTGESKQ